MDQNILFISHDRSGSNLMRTILSQHPSIYIVPALPLFEQIYPHLGAYGDLQADRDWLELLHDLTDLTNANHHPLPRSLSREEVVAAAWHGPRTLGAATQAVYGLVVASQQKPIGGIKFGASEWLMQPFLQQTKFTHVVFQYRDPRDVALSTVKAGVNPATPAEFCRHWAEWHRQVRSRIAALRWPMIETRYESLLADPERTLRRIWAFLEVAPCDGALEFYYQKEAQQAAQTSYMWQNLARPLIRDNAEKFYSQWNPFAVHKMERALGPALYDFGYERSRWHGFKSLWRQPSRRVVTKEDHAFHAAQEAVVARIKQKCAMRQQSQAAERSQLGQLQQPQRQAGRLPRAA